MHTADTLLCLRCCRSHGAVCAEVNVALARSMQAASHVATHAGVVLQRDRKLLVCLAGASSCQVRQSH